MEVIRLSGYTELEKLEIAKRFLVRKQMEQTGLTAKQIEFTDEGLNALIQGYTRESGVRNLEREVGNVCRKITRRMVMAPKDDTADKAPQLITGDKITELLGPTKFRDTTTERKSEIGAATGLAWTEVGGQILTTEATLMEGKGKLTVTGKLGDVMQESAQAAMSYIRSRAHAFGSAARFLPQPGYPPAHSGRSDPEGWPVGRHHHGDNDRERIDTDSRARRHRDDRRNHIARQGAADRRLEGKAAGGSPSRHQRSHHAEG